jgi:ferredoxin
MIISGKIKPNIDFGYVLAGDDIEKGYVLACQSELRSDIEVEITLLNKIKKEKK